MQMNIINEQMAGGNKGSGSGAVVRWNTQSYPGGQEGSLCLLLHLSCVHAESEATFLFGAIYQTCVIDVNSRFALLLV